MKRIVLLKGSSQYGALRLHIDCMERAAKKMGCLVDVYDLMDEDQLSRLPELLAGDNYFVFSFVGIDLRVDGKSIAEMAGAPHVVLIVDQPAHHMDRLKAATPDNIIAFLDHTHLAWARDFLPNCPARLEVVPPGGSVLSDVAIEQSCEEFIRRRDIPVLFTGSNYDSKFVPWENMRGSAAGNILDAAVEIALGSDAVPLQDAVKQAISTLFNQSLVAQVYPKMGAFFGALNSVVHGHRRWNGLMQLAKAKVPVHLYGNGWEKQLHRFKSFTYGGMGSMVETSELLKKTRICLNSNTNFVGGAHERVFMAQMSGAAVVSDGSSWYRDNYVDGEEIALYSWTGSPTLVDTVQLLLDNPEKLYGLAVGGYQKARVHYGWDSKLRTFIDMVDGMPKAA